MKLLPRRCVDSIFLFLSFSLPSAASNDIYFSTRAATAVEEKDVSTVTVYRVRDDGLRTVALSIQYALKRESVALCRLSDPSRTIVFENS
jgi:hypothetical protein